MYFLGSVNIYMGVRILFPCMPTISASLLLNNLSIIKYIKLKESTGERGEVFFSTNNARIAKSGGALP